MKFIKATLAAVLVAGFASTAVAQDSDSGVYINAGIDTFEFDVWTLGGKVGYNFNQYFGVEGQAGFGIIDEDLGGDADIGVDWFVGGFGVARYPVTDRFDVFARAGYQVTDFGLDLGSLSGSESFDGFGIGGGVQYFFTENDGIRFEYTYLDLGSEVGGGADTLSLSYVRNF